MKHTGFFGQLPAGYVHFSDFEAVAGSTMVQVMWWQIFILTSTFGKNLTMKLLQVLCSNSIRLTIPNACASLPNNKEIYKTFSSFGIIISFLHKISGWCQNWQVTCCSDHAFSTSVTSEMQALNW